MVMSKRLFHGQFCGIMGGGSNNKKDHAAGKNPRCPLSFLFFLKTRSKSTFLCRIWSKTCPQKRTKKIMIFVFFDFFPPNAFLRRRRKKALLRVNDRGGGWKMCILALRRVCVCTRAWARLQLTYVAMAILRKRSQFMI